LKKHSYLLVTIILAVVVLISRLPFLSQGFGSYPDAWRVANTARNIALTHQYTYSRPPGHPLQELFYSLIWNASPTVYNAVTALFSVGVLIIFALILAKIDRKKSIIGAMALVFIPVVYIASVNALDFIWALFFILASFYLAMENKFALAGIVLGLAIGCRITSAAMVVPVGVLAYYQSARWVRSWVAYSAWALGVGLITFIPVINAYKLSFFTFPEHGYPPILTVLKNASVDVFGFPGMLALIIFTCLIILKRRDVQRLFEVRDPVFLASLAAGLVFLIMFIRLPHQATYLIPAIPFVIILMSKLLDHRMFTVLCVLFILSSFIFTLNQRRFTLAGPILNERQSRIIAVNFYQDVLKRSGQLSPGSVVVTGYFLPHIEWYLDRYPIAGVEFPYLLSQADLEQILKNPSSKLYYLPGIDQFEESINGISFSAYGAQPLVPGNRP
jgi:hypothetical protein